MKFWSCFCFLVAISIISFFLGRVLPKRWFRADRFPYRAYRFENGGRIYDKLRIRKWQNKVPDMSKILPKIMPAKDLSGDYKSRLPRMLQETCVAELIHSLNCFAGFYCLKLYPGVGGIIILFLYTVLFNLPFIVIQRYNRPRLLKIANRIQQTEKATNGRGAVATCEL